MKSTFSIGLASALWLGTTVLPAQETKQVEQLQDQLRQMQENFNRLQQEQQRQIQELQKQIDALRTSASPGQPVPVPTPTSPPSTAPAATAEPPAAPAHWSPSQPIRLGSSRSYVDVSMAATLAAGASTEHDVPSLQLGGHDPNQRGVTLQGMDLTLAGAVDPYFRGQATVVYLLDRDGHSEMEIEEGYLQSQSLPGNLQLKAGQYFTEFGRVNNQHPESWAFVDAPLVNGRLFGPDGLRNPGARVSWLLPTPFYGEFFLGVQNSQGGTAYSFRDDHDGGTLFGRPSASPHVSSFADMLYSSRLALSFDLTDTQTLLLGTSAAVGPNSSGTSENTQIFGLDTFWKWKPAKTDGGYPFVSWQTEAMLRRYDAGAYAADLDNDGALDINLPRERLLDYGFYSQLAWGFHKGWVAGLRGDWIDGTKAALTPDPDREPRWRVSPALTWHPTEFSRFRLQYNYDKRSLSGTDHSVWLQWMFLLGSHPAHSY